MYDHIKALYNIIAAREIIKGVIRNIYKLTYKSGIFHFNCGINRLKHEKVITATIFITCN